MLPLKSYNFCLEHFLSIYIQVFQFRFYVYIYPLFQDKDKLSKEFDKRKDKKKKKKTKKKDKKRLSSGKDSSSDSSSNSESDSDTTSKEKDNKKPNSAHSSRSATPTPAASGVTDSLKRKQTGSPDLSQAKKLKLDNFNLVPTSYIPGTRYDLIY